MIKRLKAHITITMQTTTVDNEKDIHNYTHDIKCSLQSMMMANELIMEGSGSNKKKDFLAKTMMTDIERVYQLVSKIEKDFGTGGRHDA